PACTGSRLTCSFRAVVSPSATGWSCSTATGSVTRGRPPARRRRRTPPGTGPLPSCPGSGTATGISSARAPSTSGGCRWSRSRCGPSRCARDLRNALDAGVTSVREVGGLGVELARAVAEGVLDGPSIYGAAVILSTTGGHGDLHSYPLPWIEDYAALAGTMCLADGVAGCQRA